MRTILFTIYDEKAEVFLPPFFVPTLGIATRAFSDCINGPEHQFSKHPQDYTLFQLGEFFDDDCHFELHEKKSLGNGVEFITPSTQPDFFEGQHGKTNSPIQPNETG